MCCDSFGRVTIPASVTHIENYAFLNCYNLASFTFSENSQLTSIGDATFSDCSSLTTVYYAGTAQDWADISIQRDEDGRLTSATRYYYSAAQPTAAGNYWHWVNGIPTPW